MRKRFFLLAVVLLSGAGVWASSDRLVVMGESASVALSEPSEVNISKAWRDFLALAFPSVLGVKPSSEE